MHTAPINIKNGLLNIAKQQPSPNYNSRPCGEISLLVIHNISLPPGNFDGDWISDLFTNCLDKNADPYFQTIYQLQVSSHLLIRRNGDVIQYVPFDQRAWHAGQSEFQNCQNCNDFSIGIELEGTDQIPYKSKQYEILAQISQQLMQEYPKITKDRITGHENIAPGRKTDPGPAFQWDHYFSLLKKYSTHA
jgi:N-acetyl-anhydromuramoyl-L-alanine amidase